MHSVAELVAHLTAWNFDLVLKIKNGTGKLFDYEQANWPDVEQLKQIGWDQIRKKFQQSISEVISLLADKDDSFLEEKYYDQDFKNEYAYSFAITGMLQHLVYHLGQMGIIIKLLKEI